MSLSPLLRLLHTMRLNKLLKFTPPAKAGSAEQPRLRFGCPLARR